MNSENDQPLSEEELRGSSRRTDQAFRPSELPDYEDADDGVELGSASAERFSQFSQRRSWKRLVFWYLLLLLPFVMLPGYRELKVWRAAVLLDHSAEAFCYGDSDSGTRFLKQAIALSPGSEEVKEAVQLFNATAGDEASLTTLINRMNKGESSVNELLGIAELAIRKGNLELGNQVISTLPKHLNEHQELRLILIKAMLAARKDGGSTASAFCRANARTMKGKAARHLNFQAALYQLSDTNPDQKKEGVQALLTLMRERSEVSLSVARVLAKIGLGGDAKAGVTLSAAELMEVAQLLPMLSGHQMADVLTAADLTLLADPSSKREVINRLLENDGHASRPELLDLARWLNNKGCHDEVISLANTQHPRDDTDWLLILLDAESAKGNWSTISEMLETPAGLGIPDAVKHLFLARIAMVAGDIAGAQEQWGDVKMSLRLEKPETLAYIAGYEEGIGALDQAAITYKEMADRKETHLAGLLGQIHSLPSSTPVGKLIPLYKRLVATSPELTNAQNDFAYLKLLAGQDVPAASASAEKLFLAEPTSLSRITTAALGRLKSGNAKAALSLYEGKNIDWERVPDPWKVVYVAVLKTSGNLAPAVQLEKSINLASLRPEEKKLLLGK